MLVFIKKAAGNDHEIVHSLKLEVISTHSRAIQISESNTQMSLAKNLFSSVPLEIFTSRFYYFRREVTIRRK